MKNKIKVFGFIAIVLVFTLSATSCSGQSGGVKSLNSAEELKKYLDSQPANSPDKPIKVSMGANGPMLPKIAEAINASGKYVSLNITGNALTEIPEDAFENCETLVSITIPDSVTSIGSVAFYRCTSLTSVTIGNGVTSISGSAFQSCTKLASVTIPNGVTIIEMDAFIYCTNLTSVTFQGTIPSDKFGSKLSYYDELKSPFYGDLRDKYLAGGIGTYTTTAPVGNNSKWTKQ
jgi:hypothetical protein